MGKEEIARRIRTARIDAGLTQAQAADAAGISYQAISNYERGINKIDVEILMKLCSLYNISILDIISPSDQVTNLQPADLTPTIPVVASVAAGNGMCAVADFEGYHIAPPGLKNHDEYCYFRVKGESMAPDIKDGELVLVHLQPEVENGEIAVVIVNGEDGLVKRVQYQDDCMVLLSSNPAYPPRLLVGHDLDDVIIWGKVVYVWRAL